MAWRWVIVGVPSGWLTAYKLAPVIRVNITILVTLVILPYAFHHGTMWFIRRLPQRHVVIFRETPDLSEITNDDIVSETVDDPFKAMLDLDMTDEMEEHIDVSSRPRKRRGA